MDAFNFTPFPELSTERLILRQLSMQDDKEIFFLRSDERVLKYLVITKAGSIEEARAFIHKINNGIAANEWAYWGICLRNETKLTGTICFWNISKEENKAEIGYVLHPDYQGRGLMQEAFTKALEYSFEEMKLRSVEAVLHPENIRSINLLQRNGFIYQKKKEEAVVYVLANPATK